MIKVSLVDDHALLRSGLASVINSFDGFKVLFEADNGKHFIEKLKKSPAPDIILLDVTMPEMNGFETAEWLKDNYPKIKILVLSMMDDDASIIRMLRLGAKGYILKDSKPSVLHQALKEVATKGFFFNEIVNGKLIHLFNSEKTINEVELTEKEKVFLKLCCTEKSYKEIAIDMETNTRAVEALRSTLFERLETASRVGLVIYAIKQGIVKI